MSPELTRMQKYGLKTEVWSLGATLYEMRLGCKWLDLVGRRCNPEKDTLRCTHKKLYDSPDILELVETHGSSRAV